MIDEDGNRIGESLGCHETEDAARQQIEALYANVPEGQMVGEGADEEKAVSGATNLPLASRTRAWTRAEAETRVRNWADATEEPNAQYRRAFFWYDGDAPENFTSYKLQFADAIDGELQAVPRGIFAVAAVLQGARGGVDIPEADQGRVRSRVSGYYARMRREFDDDSIVPPWEKSADAEHEEKEGRVLSTANANRIASAVEALIQVLGAAGIEINGDDEGKAIYPTQNKTVNLGQLLDDIVIGFYKQHPDEQGIVYWVEEVWDDCVMVKQEGTERRLWKVPYQAGEQGITFAPKQEWLEGVMVFVPFAVLGPSRAGPPQVVNYSLTIQTETSEAPTSNDEVGPQEDAAPTDERLRLTEIERERINIAMEV